MVKKILLLILFFLGMTVCYSQNVNLSDTIKSNKNKILDRPILIKSIDTLNNEKQEPLSSPTPKMTPSLPEWLINLVGSLVGVIIGSLLTYWLTLRGQKKLLSQQLEAQEKIHQEILKTITAVGEQAQMHITSAIGAAHISSLLH